MNREELLKIPVREKHGDCLSECCPFKKECASHYSVGEFRLESGFTPEIFWDDETDEFFCLTAKRKPVSSIYIGNSRFPENVDSLLSGFISIKKPL